MANTINISVKELTADWRLSPGDPMTSMTGFRKFIEVPGGVGSNAEAIELPNIGSPWDSDFPQLLVVRIEEGYTQDDPNQGLRTFGLYYETRWINTQALINDGETGPFDETVLEVDIEAGTESITIDNNTGSALKLFKWEGAGTDVTQSLFNLVITSTMRVKRYVPDDSMETFIGMSNLLVGHVNLSDFYGSSFTAGTVLYNGFTSHGVISETGRRKHLVEMNFLTRLVTGGLGGGSGSDSQPEADGWNYIYNDNRTDAAQPIWDRPYTMKGAAKWFLYQGAGLASLFTTALETQDIPALDSSTK